MDYSHTEVLTRILQSECLFTFCFVISSLFLLSNSYAGFITFIYGLAMASAIVGKWYSVSAKDRVIFGVCLGVVSMQIVMTLQFAIFWGQSSGCVQQQGRRLLSAECNQVGAMKSVCTFSVFSFLADLALLFVLLKHKDDLLPAGSSIRSNPTAAADASSLYKQVPQTADL
jgi:hypothetical protein